MSKRTIALVVAIALAALAAVALVSYVGNIEERELAEQEPVTVFRAKLTIPAGTSAADAESQGLIETATVAKAIVPATAITSLTDISGKVASVTIPPSEVLILDRWVAPGQAGSSLTIPQNRVALTIEVGIPPGVAGFIRTGDSISIIATAPGGQNGQNRSQFIVQDIEVLATGRRVITVTQEGSQGESTETPVDRVLLTLAVTPTQAERIVFGQSTGQLYFTLLPPNFRPGNTSGRTVNNLFP